MDNPSIKRRISRLREEKGYTQQNMADMLDIDRNTYRSIETGKTELIYKRMEDIARILGVSVETLITGVHEQDEDGLSARLEEERAAYSKKVDSLTKGYDDRVSALEKDLKAKEEIIEILKGQIRDKDEIIALLRKKGGV